MAMTETAPPPGEDEDLVINLEADEAKPAEKPEEKPGEKAIKPPPVPGPSTSATPAPSEAGLADLEKQVENERRLRERAIADSRRMQQERDQAIAFAQEAERRGVSTYELYADQQIQALQDNMDAVAAAQEAAMNDGNFKEVAELNKRLGRLGGQLAQAERDKGALAQQRERMKTQSAQRQPPRQQPAAPAIPTDPFERALVNRTEATKSFLRKHPDLIRSDGSLKRSAIEAHEKALDEGHAVDSDGYFRSIEANLAGQAREPAADAAPAKPQPGYAAPVVRGPAPGGSGVGANGTFVMTPKMRRLADEQGVTPQEWANNYVRLLKEGRITPIS